jgi:hypothetical protein
MRPQVCVISVITSIFWYFLPVFGRCMECTSNDPDDCVKGGRRADSGF